jgi:hypothetical protein
MSRSFATRVGVVALFVLLASAALSLAGAPSRPGMFLYPVRALTQQVTGTFLDTVVIAVPAALRETAGGGQSTSPEADNSASATSDGVPTSAVSGAVDYVDQPPPSPTAIPVVDRWPDATKVSPSPTFTAMPAAGGADGTPAASLGAGGDGSLAPTLVEVLTSSGQRQSAGPSDRRDEKRPAVDTPPPSREHGDEHGED